MDCGLFCVRDKIGDEFAMNAGYNEVGELNNIIMLYPQAIATASNPNGCWDWWGYTVYFYGNDKYEAIYDFHKKTLVLS